MKQKTAKQKALLGAERPTRVGRLAQRMLKTMRLPPKLTRFLAGMMYRSHPDKVDLERLHRLWGLMRWKVEEVEATRSQRRATAQSRWSSGETVVASQDLSATEA